MTHTSHIAHRLPFLTLGVLCMVVPLSVAAAGPTLTFSPHCTASIAGGADPLGGSDLPTMDEMVTPGNQIQDCPTFEVHDPSSLETDILNEGDTLQLVPVIKNSDHAAVTGVHVWLSYDPTMLKGESIQLDPSFSIPTPGESDFDESQGYAKIGGASSTELNGDMLPVGIIKFTVLKTTTLSTVISYFDAGNADGSHTTILGKGDSDNQPILSSDPLGSLFVRLATDASSVSSASSSDVSSAVSSAASSVMQASSQSDIATTQDVAANFAAPDPTPAAPAAGTTIFPSLQVTNLRVTTQGSSAFLGWDALPSQELAGYNVYYGTVSGQYLQRRTIDKSDTTLTIRDLPQGTTYFFAIRGADASGNETDFSKEVSVTIGNPKTSTAPLTASLIDNGPNGKGPSTGGQISGETGTASTLLLIVGACAIVGTFLAMRRQLVAHTHLTHG